jgi:hypothetical protein
MDKENNFFKAQANTKAIFKKESSKAMEPIRNLMIFSIRECFLTINLRDREK